jgi:glycerol-3-phosphate O-acyltransferase
METISEKEVRELEDQASYLKGEKARMLKERAASALARAEAAHVGPDLVDRLDMLLLNLTEASRDICTNTRCPHYGKKCKMR